MIGLVVNDGFSEDVPICHTEAECKQTQSNGYFNTCSTALIFKKWGGKQQDVL